MSFPACQELFSTFFEVVFVSLLQQLWYLITSNRLLSRTFSFLFYSSLSDTTRLYYHESFQMSRTFFISFHQRRRRDLNPRTAQTVYTLSRGTSSATWVLLHVTDYSVSKINYTKTFYICQRYFLHFFKFFNCFFDSLFYHRRNLRCLHPLVFFIRDWLQKMYLYRQLLNRIRIKGFVRIDQSHRHDGALGFDLSLIHI